MATADSTLQDTTINPEIQELTTGTVPTAPIMALLLSPWSCLVGTLQTLMMLLMLSNIISNFFVIIASQDTKVTSAIEENYLYIF